MINARGRNINFARINVGAIVGPHLPCVKLVSAERLFVEATPVTLVVADRVLMGRAGTLLKKAWEEQLRTFGIARQLFSVVCFLDDVHMTFRLRNFIQRF